MGTATAPGWIVGDRYAGTSIEPFGEVSFTTSPWRMPSCLAVSVLISAQESHTDCVIVSGTSCSHERLAARPSYQRLDGYAMSASPSPPSSLAGAGSTRSTLAVTPAAPVSRHTPPWLSASAHWPFTTGSHAVLRYCSNDSHGSGPLPASPPSAARPAVNSTSPIARASRIGFIVGCSRPLTPSIGE